MSTEPQKFFMSGIGGIGMSALAQLLVAVSYTHLTLPTNREV